jgi:hypothetical protein
MRLDRDGFSLRREELCGAGEVRIYGDAPLIKQPFGDVAPISVLVAPVAEFIRADVVLRHQVQVPDLYFKRGSEGWSGRHGTAPGGIAARASH